MILRKAFVHLLPAALLVACSPEDDAEDAEPKATQLPRIPPAFRQIVLKTSNSQVGAEVATRLASREQPAFFGPSDEPENLMKEFEGASPERREEIIALLGASGAPGAWSFLCGQAASSSQAIRLAALNSLAVHNGGDPSAVIATGLDFSDEETRALAANLLGRRVQDERVWVRAATDASPDVRTAYLAAVEHAPASFRITAARAALVAGDPQLRRESASVLGGVRNKTAVELLIPLLDDPEAGGIAADGIFYFFGRSFNSAAEARVWWFDEKESFTSDLLQAPD